MIVCFYLIQFNNSFTTSTLSKYFFINFILNQFELWLQILDDVE